MSGWSAIASNHEAIALCLYLAEHEALGKKPWGKKFPPFRNVL
jgi:hypothetical protein